MIQDGKGIGGQIDIKGNIMLSERNSIAGEDQTRYNSGLVLLSEAEKIRLTDDIIDARKEMLSTKNWSEECDAAFGYLKGKLDPLHTYELKPYLNNFPQIVGGAYLFALAGQALFRGVFPAIYIVSVVCVFLPAAFLLLVGV